MKNNPMFINYAIYVSKLRTSTLLIKNISICYVPLCRSSNHVYSWINIYFNSLSYVENGPLTKPRRDNTDNSL
jgi:hypothetical protein